MPPKVLFTKEEITDAAVRVVRKKGSSALTARSLAAELGCSVKPIFGAFKNMDEVRSEVIKASEKIYRDRLAQAEKDGKNPPYKSAGLAYIKFAKEEKELFKLLFMRSRSDLFSARSRFSKATFSSPCSTVTPKSSPQACRNLKSWAFRSVCRRLWTTQ